MPVFPFVQYLLEQSVEQPLGHCSSQGQLAKAKGST